MTNSLKGVFVSFDNDIMEDDAEFIMSAIKMIKGVQSVEANVVNADDWMNRERIRIEMKQKIYDSLKNI